MTEKGFILCRPFGETALNGLEYLLNDKNEIRHFNTEEEVAAFRKAHGLDWEDIMMLYHAFCMHCAKEFFFETDAMPEDIASAFYVCPDCKRMIEEQMNKIIN